jgi:deazaflavin-dependent oxidoreductase (nitroreductase family)
MSDDRRDVNRQVIEEFRANAGVVGGRFAGMPMVLVTHTGAKSGIRRTAPLVCTRDGDRVVIIASKGGAPTNPDWYHNMVANPLVTVELPGGDTFEATVHEAEGDERDRLFAAQVAVMPFFADYQAGTERKIPLLVLTRSAS